MFFSAELQVRNNPGYFFSACKEYLLAVKFSQTCFEHQLFVLCVTMLIAIVTTVYRAVGFFFDDDDEMYLELSYSLVGLMMALIVYVTAGKS